MKMISDGYFKELIQAGYERRDIEYKSPFVWNDDSTIWIKEKTIRAMLAMSNTSGGGLIIIGIDEDESEPCILTGLNNEQFDSFQNYDDIIGCVNSFASPFIRLEIHGVKFKGIKGDYFVIVSVQEFDDIPIICKKDGVKHSKGEYILRKWDIYVRSIADKPGSIRITEYEFREMIELATQKALNKVERYSGILEKTTRKRTRKEFYDREMKDMI